jgi:amidophosphoribosyltransferase
MFEYVYLARPDSVLDGISVYQARLNLGETLAKRVISTVPPSEIDVVIPIPESSRPSAMQLAHLLGKPYREGFVKNRYVGRTFIMPGQARKKSCARSSTPSPGVQGPQRAAGRRLHRARHHQQGDRADGARGRRPQGLPGQRRAAGALPQRLRHRHADQEELVAHGRSIEEIRQIIGADALIYQDVDAMKRAIGTLNPKLASFDASCFDGVYVTGDITADDIARSTEGRAGAEARRGRQLAPGAAQRNNDV